ncbi:MAG TPA: BON domain-containing protein [Candidatus Acidoferrales bacterium]|nr:BON domain-containing protein [Candidatus Acidoferrales bacterium]
MNAAQIARRLAGILIAIGLCSSLLSAGPRAANRPAIRAVAQQSHTRSDAHFEDWLKNEVRHQLVLLPYYSIFDNLEYSIDGATVTLQGQVVHATIKDDAESAVKKIEGVEKVVNNIEILPPSPDDDQIRRAEYRAIYGFGPLEKYALYSVASIHIIVKGGHVTLEGVVDNQADKDAANVRANGVANVFSVTNNLKVVK